jgi:hypothetical protein
LQERAHLPPSRVKGPLPDESTFVVQAREAMLAPRTTTAQTRSGLVARGRARTTTTIAQASAEGSGRGRGSGRAKGKKKAAKDGGSKPARGRGRGSSKRKASTLDDAPIPETGTNLTRTYPIGQALHIGGCLVMMYLKPKRQEYQI